MEKSYEASRLGVAGENEFPRKYARMTQDNCHIISTRQSARGVEAKDAPQLINWKALIYRHPHPEPKSRSAQSSIADTMQPEYFPLLIYDSSLTLYYLDSRR
ncbi:hypothetical protein Agabi119p4_7575 [Agaricus bisporus var. burnettii]|uniref:Uncharacterized protein n=1 Tax=Agaricus bisporus var. burnettii TaxID=192524 RepID=A0A8H7C7V8_AGABI|nr:hypothetical protein Agabi119p4_7575 [Agaricus bisporus var. burnettii]